MKRPLTIVTAATVMLAGLLLLNSGKPAEAQPAAAAAPSGLAELEGKLATIEYRPVQSATGYLQKQRTGTLHKVTDNWVIFEADGITVAAPREMILEIRLEKK